MKNYDYDKITDEVFCRAEAVRAKQRKKKRVLVGTLTPLCLFVITVSVCLPSMLSRGYVSRGLEDEASVLRADNACQAEDEIPDGMCYNLYDYGIKNSRVVLYAEHSLSASLADSTTEEDDRSQMPSTILRGMISESDDIVLAYVLDAQKTGAENETAYTLRVLSSYKGALSENDEFTVTVCGDQVHKVGEKKVCFLSEGSEGKKLISGNLGMLSESDGSSGGTIITLDELSEEIKKTEETE